MVAQAYAEQRVFEHNADRVSQQSTFNSVGENLAVTTGSANYTRLVMNWYDENQDYDYAANSCASGQVCGHYTQVVISLILLTESRLMHIQCKSYCIDKHGKHSSLTINVFLSLYQ